MRFIQNYHFAALLVRKYQKLYVHQQQQQQQHSYCRIMRVTMVTKVLVPHATNNQKINNITI
jgi:hypothetical protein